MRKIILFLIVFLISAVSYSQANFFTKTFTNVRQGSDTLRLHGEYKNVYVGFSSDMPDSAITINIQISIGDTTIYTTALAQVFTADNTIGWMEDFTLNPGPTGTPCYFKIICDAIDRIIVTVTFTLGDSQTIKTYISGTR